MKICILSTICQIELCFYCAAYTVSLSPTSEECPDWCVSNEQRWSKKCSWPDCSGCSDCSGQNLFDVKTNIVLLLVSRVCWRGFTSVCVLISFHSVIHTQIMLLARQSPKVHMFCTCQCVRDRFIRFLTSVLHVQMLRKTLRIRRKPQSSPPPFLQRAMQVPVCHVPCKFLIWLNRQHHSLVHHCLY